VIAHSTGKQVQVWDGTMFVLKDEVVHFTTEQQRDKHLAEIANAKETPQA
jgi:ribosomal protein L27